MADTTLSYEPTQRFTTQNVLYGNHFRFTLEALPDLTFFAQSVTIPTVIVPVVQRATPFTKIKEVGDHIEYGSFDVSYLIDAEFKNYRSLLWWMQGYGFPHSYEEVTAFREARAKKVSAVYPLVRELEKTRGVLYILQPDTESIVVEIQLSDVFPVALGQLNFSTDESDTPQIKTIVTFQCTSMELVF